MAEFLNFNPNDSQAQVRQVILSNFSNATLKPESRSEQNKLYGLVGVASEGSQQLLIAKDGTDYLSPVTGITKNNSNQTINGQLSVQTLNVATGGAKIANSLYVYSPSIDNTVSFSIDSSKKLTAYGNAEFKENVIVIKKLTVNGGIESLNGTSKFGATQCSGLTVSGTGTITTLKATNATLNGATVSGILTVNGEARLNSTLKVGGNTTFAKQVEITAPGAITSKLVRPLYVGTSAPGSLSYGVLYGQY